MPLVTFRFTSIGRQATDELVSLLARTWRPPERLATCNHSSMNCAPGVPKDCDANSRLCGVTRRDMKRGSGDDEVTRIPREVSAADRSLRASKNQCPLSTHNGHSKCFADRKLIARSRSRSYLGKNPWRNPLTERRARRSGCFGVLVLRNLFARDRNARA